MARLVDNPADEASPFQLAAAVIQPVVVLVDQGVRMDAHAKMGISAFSADKQQQFFTPGFFDCHLPTLAGCAPALYLCAGLLHYGRSPSACSLAARPPAN